MGILNSIFGNLRSKSTENTHNKNHRPNKSFRRNVKIGYIVYTTRDETNNESQDHTFVSKKNAFGCAIRYARQTHRTATIHKVNLNNYSTGCGDTINIHRHGIYKTWNIR